MKGLSAKVFRTYNASITFERELLKTDPEASVADKLLAYNRANREVAVLCNHQRSVPKTHAATMERMGDKVRAVKYQRMKLRHQLASVEPKYKKKFPEYAADESDMDEEWVQEHEKALREKERTRVAKKFEKDNEKLKTEGGQEMKAKELEERLEAVDEMYDEIEKETKNKVYVGHPFFSLFFPVPRFAYGSFARAETKKSADKIIESLVKIDKRIEAQKIAAVDKEEGKETSLGTSKIK
jgi:DNA topoisomerase-1